MSYNTSQFPISQATDSNYLYSQLGYFWHRVFKDKGAVIGLTQAIASAAEQDYTQIFEIINSYSATNIPVFNNINWYPLVVTADSLDNNTLLFGEGVTFGAQVSGNSYYFGRPIPEDTNVYSMLAPAGLENLSIVADQILKPSTVWINGQTIKLQNGRIFFYGNPLASGIPVTDGPGGEQVTLWCYNAQVDSNNLFDNLGFLFGLNVDHTDAGKQVLTAMLNLVVTGASIDNITEVCNACLGSAGGSVEVVDQVIMKNWWLTQLTAGPANRNIPIFLPPQVFVTGYKSMLRFDNTVDPVTTTNGIISFPVSGSPADVVLFNQTVVESDEMQASLVEYLNGSSMINPVDFIFKSVLGAASTLIRVKFANTDQLSMFETVFSLLKNNLPKHVNFIFLCDIEMPNDVATFRPSNVTEVATTTLHPILTTLTDVAHMNFEHTGAGLVVKDMLTRRTIPVNAVTTDFPNLSFTIVPT